jgi:hypothetical protein
MNRKMKKISGRIKYRYCQGKNYSGPRKQRLTPLMIYPASSSGLSGISGGKHATFVLYIFIGLNDIKKATRGYRMALLILVNC